LKVEVFVKDVTLPLSKKQIKKTVQVVWKQEAKKPKGQISAIFVGNEYIKNLNKTFLARDYPTDVIAFRLEEQPLEGEVYINVERAAEQAEQYHQTVTAELNRLLIHGILHLLGYGDSTEQEKKQIKEKEDFYLSQVLD